MSFRILKLEKESDLQDFHDKFCSKIDYMVPLEYFKMGDCYGMYVGGVMSAGYCIVHASMYNLRSIKQIPDYEYYYLGHDDLDNVAEFTGYFIENKRHSIFFTAHLLFTLLFHRADRFVGSYPVEQKGLSEYYRQGNPWHLYTGVPRPLDGHSGHMKSERVDVVTKGGVLKIFWARTIKIVGSYIWKKSVCIWKMFHQS